MRLKLVIGPPAPGHQKYDIKLSELEPSDSAGEGEKKQPSPKVAEILYLLFEAERITGKCQLELKELNKLLKIQYEENRPNGDPPEDHERRSKAVQAINSKLKKFGWKAHQRSKTYLMVERLPGSSGNA